MGLTAESRIYNVRTQLYKKDNFWKICLILSIIFMLIGISLIIIAQKRVNCIDNNDDGDKKLPKYSYVSVNHSIMVLYDDNFIFFFYILSMLADN